MFAILFHFLFDLPMNPFLLTTLILAILLYVAPVLISFLSVSAFIIFFIHYLFPFFMGQKINVGDTIAVHSGNHQGKLTVVLDLTPKMVYLKFKCSSETTRVMFYKVTLLHDDLPSHDFMQDDQLSQELLQELWLMRDSINNIPRTTSSGDDSTDCKKEIIQEIKNMKQSMYVAHFYYYYNITQLLIITCLFPFLSFFFTSRRSCFMSSNHSF
jgi:hypothetical protein